MGLFFKSKEERQKEFDAKLKKAHLKWLQSIEKEIRKRTKKLNFVMELESVTPDSDRETLTIFHDILGHLTDYGVVLSGTIHQCNFLALIPFPNQNDIRMHFEIPIPIDWEASYVYKRIGFSSGAWVCRPWNGRRAGQMNRKFPRPVVAYGSSAEQTIKPEGGHICSGEGGITELVLYPFCPAGREAVTVANYLNTIGDVVSLLNKWSNK